MDVFFIIYLVGWGIQLEVFSSRSFESNLFSLGLQSSAPLAVIVLMLFLWKKDVIVFMLHVFYEVILLLNSSRTCYKSWIRNTSLLINDDLFISMDFPDLVCCVICFKPFTFRTLTTGLQGFSINLMKKYNSTSNPSRLHSRSQWNVMFEHLGTFVKSLGGASFAWKASLLV